MKKQTDDYRTATQSARVEMEQQTALYTEHVRVQRAGRPDAHTLRVHVRLNSYVNQSYGTVKRWNGEQWHTVAEMAGAALHVCTPTLPGSGGSSRVHYERATLADFQSDRDRLLDLAAEVLA